jgi:dTDP-4-amino-4,6-dideoxygalactose transaminase
MSEYHAAVGLAELDAWTRKKQQLRRIADAYRRGFARIGRADDFFGAPDVAGCYALFRCRNSGEASRCTRSLASARIDYRFWYGGGLLAQPYFRDASHDDLPVTSDIASRLIGLPMAADLGSRVIGRVVAAVAEGTARQTSQ